MKTAEEFLRKEISDADLAEFTGEQLKDRIIDAMVEYACEAVESYEQKANEKVNDVALEIQNKMR